MSYASLQSVIGNAVVDAEFRKGLLNGSRGRIISRFSLTAEEQKVLMGIQADSLEHFAGQLDQWLAHIDSTSQPPSLPRSLKFRSAARATSFSRKLSHAGLCG